MLILSFFQWWYGPGWKGVLRSLSSRIHGVTAAFSVPQLARTLFSPWRRIITYPGASLEARFRAWGDNMFSRAIGFVVRLGVLFAAAVSIAAVGLGTVAELIIWPFVPVLVPILLVLAVAS